MMREIAWKECRENRWKYGALWLVFNLPIFALALALAVSKTVRTPFADLSNGTFMKYLPIPLFESAMVVSIFLLVSGFVGLATFLPEVDDKSMFFVFELPLARWRYAVAKMLNGSLQVALAVSVSILLAPAVVYGMMLLGGKVTMGASGAAFGVVMAAAARAAVWCSLISIAAFAGSALIGTVLPRWWPATACVFVFIILFANAVMGGNRFFNGASFFDLFADVTAGTLNISAGIGSAQWLNVSGNLPLPTGFARWHVLPMVTPVFLAGLFTAGIAWVVERKELK